MGCTVGSVDEKPHTPSQNRPRESERANEEADALLKVRITRDEIKNLERQRD